MVLSIRLCICAPLDVCVCMNMLIDADTFRKGGSEGKGRSRVVSLFFCSFLGLYSYRCCSVVGWIGGGNG